MKTNSLQGRIFLFFLTMFYLPLGFGQNQAAPQATVDFYFNNYKNKGVLVDKEKLSGLDLYQLMRIDEYNFDDYRNEKTRREIQLVGGPSIRLESINERLAKNVSVDPEIIEKKAGEVIQSGQYAIVTKIDIGLLSRPVEQGENWKSN